MKEGSQIPVRVTADATQKGTSWMDIIDDDDEKTENQNPHNRSDTEQKETDPCRWRVVPSRHV